MPVPARIFDVDVRQVGSQQLKPHPVLLEALVYHIACIMDYADAVGIESVYQLVGEARIRRERLVVNLTQYFHGVLLGEVLHPGQKRSASAPRRLGCVGSRTPGRIASAAASARPASSIFGANVHRLLPQSDGAACSGVKAGSMTVKMDILNISRYPELKNATLFIIPEGDPSKIGLHSQNIQKAGWNPGLIMQFAVCDEVFTVRAN